MHLWSAMGWGDNSADLVWTDSHVRGQLASLGFSQLRQLGCPPASLILQEARTGLLLQAHMFLIFLHYGVPRASPIL